MALALADRVQETSTTSGTGTISLLGAATGYKSFTNGVGNGNSTYYCIYDTVAYTWEVGIGTYTTAGSTLSRTTVLSNSSNTTSLISFAGNLMNVFVTYPSEITSGVVPVESITTNGDALIAGLTVGKGTGFFTRNTAVGTVALAANSSGDYNTALGYQTLNSNTSAADNTAIGNHALFLNTTGYSNTATGSQALNNNVGGDNNTATGQAALFSNTSGYYNTATGSQALYNNTTGTSNTANGWSALTSNISGIGNIAFGRGALSANTTGSSNSAIGYQALYNNTTSSNNFASGYQALYSNTGDGNFAAGYSSAFSNTSGIGITAIGYNTLYLNTTGNYNTAIGPAAAYFNTSGSGLTAIGFLSLYHNTVGTSNTAVGGYDGTTYGALYFNTSGINNTAVGTGALQATTTTSNNAALGYTAGSTNVTGASSIFVGANSQPSTNADSNTIVIGAGATGLGSNTTVIGNSSTTSTKLFGALSLTSALTVANGGTGATTLAGASIVTYTGTETLTNKRIDPRTVSVATASTLTPDVSLYDQYSYSALASALAINAPTGTPVDGTKLIFRILDNGTTRTITWNATFTSMVGTAFTNTFATTVSKTTYFGCIYNLVYTRWDVVAVTTQA
jgi:hypothetical protein